MSLYFAYGSNLSEPDRRRWCAAHREEASGLDDFVARVVGPAYLPDHEPVYRYRSAARGGGALDVRPRRGAIVPGALLELAGEAGLRALLEKEGGATTEPGSRSYDLVDAIALTPDGRAVVAHTFRVSAVRIAPRFVAPAPGYAELVEVALRRLGLDPGRHAEAARGEPVAPLAELFVYGTLLAGEPREPLLGEVLGRAQARVRGRLVDCVGDGYPALIDVGAPGGGTVEGELVTLADPGGALARLDELEWFEGFGRAGSLYERRLVAAEVEALEAQEVRDDPVARARSAVDGLERRLAWIYVMEAAPPSARAIPSGSWRRRAEG